MSDEKDKTAQEYEITPVCTGCGACFAFCRRNALIKLPNGKYAIDAERCDSCGVCYSRCPLKDRAVRRREE